MREVLVKNEGKICWINLNAPERMNAFSLTMIDELCSALIHADKNTKVEVIILSGEGKSFCAGGDLKKMKNKEEMFSGEANELRRNYHFGIQNIPRVIENLETPLIAMVNGAAIGAGCDLACMCDMRIGSQFARFGETFSKLSLVPGDGGTYFLPRIVGYAKAMEMVLTAKVYSAEDAKKMGLLNILVDDSNELMSETEKLANSIIENAPVALGLTKRALRQGMRNDLQSQLELLSAYQGISQRTKDHFEGVDAFIEKRHPEFKGE